MTSHCLCGVSNHQRVDSLPVDGLTPLVARTPTGTAMTKSDTFLWFLRLSVQGLTNHRNTCGFLEQTIPEISMEPASCVISTDFEPIEAETEWTTFPNDVFKWYFGTRLFEFLLKFQGNMLAKISIVYVTACRTGSKPLPEPMMTNQSSQINTCMRHSAITHLPLAPHICVSELGPHWFR